MAKRSAILAEKKYIGNRLAGAAQLNNELGKIYRSYLNFTIGRSGDWTGKTSEHCAVCTSVDVTSPFSFQFPLLPLSI